MNNYIEQFFDEFEYPAEARNALLKAHKNVWEEKVVGALVDEYEKHHTLDWDAAVEKMKNLANRIGENPYTVYLLFFIYLTDHARDLYKSRGLDYEIFKDTFADLKHKMMKCYRRYGVWGTFITWFDRFFELTRFALGRLEYETHTFDLDMEYKGLKKGDTVINIHIPACGTLDKKAVEESLNCARKFYKPLFNEGKVPFVCSSWLLYPKNREFLPPTSNILNFLDMFDIIQYNEDESFCDCWRIFNTDYNGNPDDLPTNTSLQKSLVKWIKSGGVPGHGFGIIY